MPLQDLTPQLRTRLNRMERAVGWFIMFATVLLIVGLGYYIYKAAESRGWFEVKAPYYIYAESAEGLQINNAVTLMGFTIGKITRITEMPPQWHEHTTNNVYIEFEVIGVPNFMYVWTEGSYVQIKQAGFLNSRVLDITKGTGGYATYAVQSFQDDMTVQKARESADLDHLRLGQEIREGTNVLIACWKPLTNNLDKIAEVLGTNEFSVFDVSVKKRAITAVWNDNKHGYVRFYRTNIFGLERVEEAALTDRLNAMVSLIQGALPGILDLTNKVDRVLANTSQLTSNLSAIVADARPAVGNLNSITKRLNGPNGSLGEWVIPTNINQKLDTALQSANGTLQTADGTLSNLDTNLMTLNLTLQNLANMTSNLNNQVQVNSNILSNISDAVVHSDQFIQGLKRFWLFKHLFRAHKSNTKAPPPKQQHHSESAVSPKQTND
ncbi:MAG TPA: MlaD family protein [Verrucomicrobiae bacterium]|nr:MlaD family protein [Verrucomicrobiae bacterium]